MTNEKRQSQLDNKKWLTSEKAGYDKSGDMDYCNKCDYQTPSRNCSVKHVYRETNCLCARAYNRKK